MGYLDEEKKTLETFTENLQWYRTGDMGSIDEEGYITLQGRKKVKSSHNISKMFQLISHNKGIL